MRLSPGCGASGESSSCLRTPSSRRISDRACLPAALIASKDATARAGSCSTTTGPASACTTIIDT
jgi:hypothetical protein